MLSQLSYALHDKQARTLLEQRAPLADMLAHLRTMTGRS